MTLRPLTGLAPRATLLAVFALAGATHAAAAHAADMLPAYISPGVGTLIMTWWSMFW